GYSMTENHARQVRGIDATGKVHKRSSVRRVYSHCVVIHFAAHPASKLWPIGIAACSHAEWEGSRAMAERNATRWRKEPDVEAIEILEARQVGCHSQNPRAGNARIATPERYC